MPDHQKDAPNDTSGKQQKPEPQAQPVPVHHAPATITVMTPYAPAYPQVMGGQIYGSMGYGYYPPPIYGGYGGGYYGGGYYGGYYDGYGYGGSGGAIAAIIMCIIFFVVIIIIGSVVASNSTSSSRPRHRF